MCETNSYQQINMRESTNQHERGAPGSPEKPHFAAILVTNYQQFRWPSVSALFRFSSGVVPGDSNDHGIEARLLLTRLAPIFSGSEFASIS
mmetsp:Transcript_45126/g.67020  ORF Transcript_45126/g.67020 Transcript_45126/m.67020 type:complete len:91 (-) Transcript_45126:177-449(-)